LDGETLLSLFGQLYITVSSIDTVSDTEIHNAEISNDIDGRCGSTNSSLHGVFRRSSSLSVFWVLGFYLGERDEGCAALNVQDGKVSRQ
jgi:hypothetical protein